MKQDTVKHKVCVECFVLRRNESGEFERENATHIFSTLAQAYAFVTELPSDVYAVDTYFVRDIPFRMSTDVYEIVPQSLDPNYYERLKGVDALQEALRVFEAKNKHLIVRCRGFDIGIVDLIRGARDDETP